jgi:hypothetical protein
MDGLGAAIIVVLAISYVVVRAIVFAQALRQSRSQRSAEGDGAADRSSPAPDGERDDRRDKEGPLENQ